MPFAYKKGGNQAAKQRKGRQKKKRKRTTKNYASVASIGLAEAKSDNGAVISKIRTSRFFIGGIAFISVPRTAACSTRRKSPWLTKSTRCASG